MKIDKIVSIIPGVRFKSVNEIIEINTSSYTGPEIRLEDSSVVLFDNYGTYNDMIRDVNLIDIENSEFYIENLYYNEKIDDDVVNAKYNNKDIYEVEQYLLENNSVISILKLGE